MWVEFVAGSLAARVFSRFSGFPHSANPTLNSNSTRIDLEESHEN